MIKQPFQFTWFMSEGGYRWVSGLELNSRGRATERHTFLTDAVAEYDLNRSKEYNPLIEATGLFYEFASLSLDRKAIQNFANRYGLLGLVKAFIPQTEAAKKIRSGEKEIGSYEVGEADGDWYKEIRFARNILRVWNAVKKYDRVFLQSVVRWNEDNIYAEFWEDDPPSSASRLLTNRQSDPRTFERFRYGEPFGPAMFFIRVSLAERMAKHTTRATLTEDKGLVFVPSSLIAAIWLQFARAVDGNREYRECKQCGRLFEVGGDTGRRADAQTCNDNCRQNYFRLRKKAKRRSTR